MSETKERVLLPVVETESADDTNKETMPAKTKDSFWTMANLRLTVINTLVVAGVAVFSAWTSNLLTQQALAARVDKLETVTNERGTMRDAQIKMLTDKLDNGVTKEVLKLQLDPIIKEQGEQRAILEQIRIAVVRSPQNPY